MTAGRSHGRHWHADLAEDQLHERFGGDQRCRWPSAVAGGGEGVTTADVCSRVRGTAVHHAPVWNGVAREPPTRGQGTTTGADPE